MPQTIVEFVYRLDASMETWGSQELFDRNVSRVQRFRGVQIGCRTAFTAHAYEASC